MKKRTIRAVAGLMAMIVMLSGCRTVPKMERYEIQYLNLFDTVTTIIAYTESEEAFNEKAAMIYEELNFYHKLYDIYNDYEGINNIKTVNDHAGTEPVKVEKEIIDLLVLAKAMYKKTNGKMNVACGSVLSVWHKYRSEGLEHPENAKVPPMKELKEASQHTDIDKVIIDTENSTIYLEDAKMSLDVGSIGKGFAAQRVSEAAKEAGMTNFLISIGGNIVSEGTRVDGSPWQLGIQNPDTKSSQSYVIKVKLNGETLVTSGNYQRYYTVDGKQYHHIIDMDTQMPADYFASVSIITKDSGIADALSTAVYNMPLEEGKTFIENMEHTEAFWILKDGTQIYTDGFKDYISK